MRKQSDRALHEAAEEGWKAEACMPVLCVLDMDTPAIQEGRKEVAQKLVYHATSCMIAKRKLCYAYWEDDAACETGDRWTVPHRLRWYYCLLAGRHSKNLKDNAWYVCTTYYICYAIAVPCRAFHSMHAPSSSAPSLASESAGKTVRVSLYSYFSMYHCIVFIGQSLFSKHVSISVCVGLNCTTFFQKECNSKSTTSRNF
jgi:hypothetical protein